MISQMGVNTIFIVRTGVNQLEEGKKNQVREEIILFADITGFSHNFDWLYPVFFSFYILGQNGP